MSDGFTIPDSMKSIMELYQKPFDIFSQASGIDAPMNADMRRYIEFMQKQQQNFVNASREYVTNISAAEQSPRTMVDEGMKWWQKVTTEWVGLWMQEYQPDYPPFNGYIQHVVFIREPTSPNLIKREIVTGVETLSGRLWKDWDGDGEDPVPQQAPAKKKAAKGKAGKAQAAVEVQSHGEKALPTEFLDIYPSNLGVVKIGLKSYVRGQKLDPGGYSGLVYDHSKKPPIPIALVKVFIVDNLFNADNPEFVAAPDKPK